MNLLLIKEIPSSSIMSSRYRILRDCSQIMSHDRGKSEKSQRDFDLKSGGGAEGEEVHGYSYVRKK